MAKKIAALSDYITAQESAHLLTLKHGRPIDPKYIRQLTKRKKNPVLSHRVGDRLLYLRTDIEQVIIHSHKAG
jgi:hypothetical protein